MSEIDKALELSLATTRALAAHLGRTDVVIALDIVAATHDLGGASYPTPALNPCQSPEQILDALTAMADIAGCTLEDFDAPAPEADANDANAQAENDALDDEDLDDDEVLAGLEAQIDQIADETIMAASPSDLTFLITRTDGLPIVEAHARIVIDGLWDSITDVYGALRADPIMIDPDNPVLASMAAYPTDADGARTLSAAGTGMGTFEATLPVDGVGTFTVRGIVGDIADEALAAELGMPTAADIAGLPAVPAGQHPINAVLAMVEEATGEPVPDVHVMTITYRRIDGQELTEANVAQILGSGISRGGLARFGANQEAGISEGYDDSEKVVRIALLDVGEIDARTLALKVTGYRGSHDFPGIGTVYAEAAV